VQDLISFERAAYGRAADRVARMTTILRAVTLGRLVDDISRPDTKSDERAILHRLVAAIAAILADPATELTAGDMDALTVQAGTLKQIFDLSGFGGPDFLLALLGDVAEGAPAGRLNKRLALLTLDSAHDWSPSLLSTAAPRTAWEWLVALVATKPVTSRRGQARKDRLLEEVGSMPPAEFPLDLDHLVLISSAWMMCSYSATPGKHMIKARLNPALRDMAGRWNLHDAELPPRDAGKARPVLLFAAEIMHSAHVQYRYFGQYLRQLRRRFDLVLLTEKREVDDAVAALFDRVLTFTRGADAGYLRQIGRMIRDIEPDIIFYPSIGMRHWGPLFANLRLAPIQMTALGHSSSTFCDTIDYYLLEQGYVADPGLFSETVITLPDESLIFERAAHYAPIAPDIHPAPEPLRIVFPSNALKLTPDFLTVIARIRAAASRRVELHFLPNASGLELEALRKAVLAILPGAVIHAKLPYSRYLQTLSAGDLNLSPFPFGGLHSVIDSLRQGLPVVAMEGREPHGRTDAMLLRRLGMPDWMIATSEEDYVAAALRVIGDDVLRVELSRQALALDIDRTMFGDGDTPLREEVGDAVWWLYRHHEAARADGRKSWNEADRKAFALDAGSRSTA